jgi:hypothetical protein
MKEGIEKKPMKGPAAVILYLLTVVFCILFFSPFHIANAATQIYRSVGVGGENEIASGTATALLTIDGSGNLTFSGTTIPNRVGVGDVVVYDSDNSNTLTAADDVVFIQGRTSNTVYTVKDQFGANTATTTTSNDTWAVYRAYTSLFNAEASTNNTSILPSYDTWSDGRDIRVSTGTDEIWNFACYGDTVDNTAVVISGWNTGANNYIRIYTPYLSSEVGASQRHSGKWDNSKYYLAPATDNDSITIQNSFVRIEGLQIKTTSFASNNRKGLTTSALQGMYFSSNIVKEGNTGTTGRIGMLINISPTATYSNIVYNNLIYRLTYDGFQTSGIPTLARQIFFNNTVVYVGTGYGFDDFSAGAVISKNNLGFNTAHDYCPSALNASSTNNAYRISAPPGASNSIDISGYASTSIFVDPANDNFLLKAGSPVINVGANLSADPFFSFSIDIQDQTRTGIWDVGADEYVALTLSSIATSSVYSGQATVIWTTNNPATSSVKYGLTSAYGSVSTDNNFATSHSITLTNLTPNTTYHFQVGSTDISDITATSSDLTFTTAQVKNIFYSVGQNIDDHKTGSPTITISNGVAVFSTAQTATNMGVGDKISYGYANATTTVYISAKQSNTVWNVITRTGAQPAATTTANVLKISHTFASLALALPNTYSAGAADSTHLNTNNLVTGNYVLNIPCYYDSGPDTTKVTVVYYWNTGLNNHIKIYTPNNTATEVNQSQRHSGKWDLSKYRLEVTTSGEQRAIETTAAYVKVDGLQVKVTQGDSNEVGGIGAKKSGVSGGLWVSNNIIQGVINYNTAANGIIFHDWTNTSPGYYVYAWNNVIYNFLTPDTVNGQGIYTTSGVTYAYNNTCYNGNHGFASYGSSFISKNNLAYKNVINFAGSYITASSTNNLSGPTLVDAPGANPQNAKTVSFYSTSTPNFHLLAGDANVKDHGLDLLSDKYLSISTDIDGQTRTGTWDIGADEYVPLVISVIATSSITGNSATVTWTTNNSATSTVQYGLTAGYGSASSSSSLVTSHTINLHSLNSNSIYHFRIISTDAPGITATSTDYTFRTSDITTPIISAVATSSVAFYSATITWITNENATSSVHYGTSISYGSASSSNTLASSSPSHSITLHNLATSTVYHFQISSTDISGNRSTTSDYTFTTLTPSYTLTYAAGANGSLTGTSPQTVSYGSSGSVITAVANVGYHFVNWSDSSTANPRTDTNVKGNVSVIANFAAASGGGHGDRIPPVISNIATSTKINSATISWTTNELSDSIIEFGLTTSYGKIISSPIMALTHSLNIPNLLADTIYHYHLKSTDINGNTTMTPDHFFRTLLSVSTTTPESQEEKNEIATSSPNQEPIEEIKEGSKDNLAGATSAIVNEITAVEAKNLLAARQFVALTEIEKKIYAKIIALSIKPLVQDDKYIIADFIHTGTPTTIIIGAGERGGSIASFDSAFGRLPASELDWQDVIKIANGRWPTQRNAAAEARAKIAFKKIYLRNSDSANVHDSSALMIMAYGLRPAQRNLNSEKAAIKSFKLIFRKNPATAQDWDIVRAIAYSGMKR